MNLNFYAKAILRLNSLRKSLAFCMLAVVLFVNNTQAQQAGALSFDGQNDFVIIPVKPAMNVTSNLTIEAWIKPAKSTGVQDVVSKSAAAASNSYIFPRTINGWTTIEFLLNINGAGWRTLRIPYGADKLNAWHHVAATYDGYTMRIYIDGVQSGSLNFSGTITVNNNPLALGNQAGLGEYYGGAVDEVRIFNRALSGCEISSSMFCELSGNENGLIAYYKFNQGILGVPNPLETGLNDSGPNGANGTLTNFGLLGTGLLSNWTDGNPAISSTVCTPVTPPTVTAGALLSLVPVSGTLNLTAESLPGATYSWTGPNNFTSNLQNPSIEGVGLNATGTYTVTATVNGCSGTSSVVITVAPRASGLNLDGIDDYVSTGYNEKLNSDAFSVEAWIYPTDANITNQNVVTNSDIYSQTGFKFPKTNDKWNSFTFELSVDNSWKELTASFPSSAINKWNHLAATFDGYFMRIYLNGILVGTQEVTGTYTKSSRNLMIGNNDERSEFFKGTVDEVRVWGRAVSQCEIINNMKTCELNGDNNGLANQVALTAYYRFNQGLINVDNAAYATLADSSGNNAHGTLQNFRLTGTTSNWVDGKVYGLCDYFPLPLLTASANGSVFQTGSTAKLFAEYGNNDVYNWEGPNSFASSTQNPVLNNVQEIQSGTYTVSTPYTNCVVTASTRIKVSDLPQIIADGPTSFCPSGSVQLTSATTGTAYQWFKNDVAINGATSVSYVASQSGNYSVKITNGSVVIISAPLVVTVVPDVTAPVPNVASLPTINVTAPATVTTVPTATDACRGAITGTTTSPLTFNTSGTYTIVWNYNDGNGNTSTQNQTVIVARPVDVTAPVLTVPASITVAANGATCNAVVTFAATATEESEDPTVIITYSQNPGTAFPIGTTTVNVTAKDAAGNTSTGSFTVTVTASVVAPITGTTTVCLGSSTTLATTSTGGTWSSSDPTVATVNASGVVTGVAAGSANITYTNACGASASAAVTVNARPVAPTVTAVNNCGSTLLTASNTTGTVNWNTAATGSSITVTTAGTYTATQTVNGCASTAGTVVAAPKAAPATPVVNVVNNCGTSTLTVANPTGTLVWSNGETTTSITVSNSATYTVTQTSNGCTSAAGSGVSAPKAAPSAPTVTVVNNCGTSTLTASNTTGSILWSNGASTASINVSAAGIYTVTQTVNGCVSANGSGVAAPKAVQATPVITVTNNCGSTTLTSNTGGTWSNGATGTSITVTTGGNYSVTATNAAGCSATATTAVTVNTNPSVAAITGNTSVAAGATTQLSDATTGGVWSSNSANATVNASGLVTGVNVGTATITYTVTNGAGCSTSVSTVVTVTPSVPTCTAPVFTSAASNISVNSCANATASYSLTVGGTSPALTYTFSGATTASGSGTGSGATFNVGVTTVTVRAVNNCGSVSQTFTVTVKSLAAPVPTVASLPTITGQCSAGLTITSTPTNNNACNDDCRCCRTVCHCKTSSCKCRDWNLRSIVAYLFNLYFGGSSDDSHDCDGDDNGGTGGNTAGNAPTARDACSGATIVGTTTDPLTYTAQGTYTINWKFVDARGNVTIQPQTVIVNDTQAPVPQVSSLPAITGTCGLAITSVPKANDACAGVVNGTTTDPLTYTAKGTYTIRWTYTDGNGNTSTQNQTVNITGGPVATITATGTSNDLCGGLVLTGSSSVSGASFKWMSGNTVLGTSSQLSLGQDDQEGTYSLYVTAGGCTSTAATYTYSKQGLAGSYTILASKSAMFGKYSKVSSGSVGITTTSGSVSFKGYTAVNGAGSFVKAPYISKTSSDNILKTVSGVATVTGVPAMQYNTSNANSYSNYTTAQYATVSLSGNYKTLKIKKGTYATLSGTIFGTIDLEEGASVRFTNSTINIDKLLVEDGARDGYYSYVRFAPNTSVRVSTQVSIGSQVLVNPDNYRVTFFVGDKSCDEERFTVKGADTRFNANIIMPDGKLFVTSTDCDNDYKSNCGHGAHSSWQCPHNGHNHKACDHRSHNTSDCNDDVYMTGTFVVEMLESKGNTVIWNSYDCSSSPVPVTVVNKSVPAAVSTQAVTSESASAATSEEELKVTVMPNPSTTYFTLKFESKYETPINMRVMDANGRVVDAQTKIGSNSTIRVGANYASGTYFAEMTQGGTRKVIQLIKVRG